MAQEDPKRYQFQATDNVGAVKQFTDYQFLDAKDPLGGLKLTPLGDAYWRKRKRPNKKTNTIPSLAARRQYLKARDNFNKGVEEKM